MALTHMHASGMGGIRTAGDLVARMQMSKKMRLNEAKAYVAGKLKISVADLSDEKLKPSFASRSCSILKLIP